MSELGRLTADDLRAVFRSSSARVVVIPAGVREYALLAWASGPDQANMATFREELVRIETWVHPAYPSQCYRFGYSEMLDVICVDERCLRD